MILSNKEFSEVVEEFLTLTAMPITTFGRNANKDARFIYDLRKGRSYCEEIKDRVLTYMRTYTADHQYDWKH